MIGHKDLVIIQLYIDYHLNDLASMLAMVSMNFVSSTKGTHTSKVALQLIFLSLSCRYLVYYLNPKITTMSWYQGNVISCVWI